MPMKVVSSDQLVQSSYGASAGGNTASPVVNGTDNLTKQIAIAYPGTYRVSFWVRIASGAFTAVGQIGRNRGGTRAAVGGPRTATTGTGTYFIEDIPGWEDGDILELHCTSESGTGTNAQCGGLVVYGHIANVPEPAPAGIVLKDTI